MPASESPSAPASLTAERPVPRFFFHVYDGVSLPDDEGTELPDWQAARTEAIATAGRIVADEGKRLKLGEDWRMEVTDDRGLLLFRLDFHITESPAIGHARPMQETS